jgi:hypothetical protein
MPEAAVQDVDAEGGPQGRSAPGGGKIAGFPLWVWGAAAVGTFAVVWFLRNRSGTSTAASTQVGAAAGTGSDLGVTTTDPMTAAALLQAMQSLATRLGATSNSPAAAVAPSSGSPSASATAVIAAAIPTGPTIPSQAGAVSSAHSSGGSSTALTTVPGIPLKLPSPAPWLAQLAIPIIPMVTSKPIVTTTIIPVPKPTNIVQVIQRIISGPIAPKVVTSSFTTSNPLPGPTPAPFAAPAGRSPVGYM